MYTDMERWSEIRRRVLVEGESKRSIQRRYGLHWDTLEKMLEHPEPPGYRLSRPRVKRKIGPYLAIIQQIIEDDKSAPKKQRHTAKRIFERLRDEHGFDGGYTIVKDAVRERRLRGREVFVPLKRDPGEAQVDYGEAKIDFRGERISVAVFEMSLPYSGAIFTQVYPRECTESFQDGHRRAFEFFGGVPRRISYYNTKIAVKKIIGAHIGMAIAGMLRRAQAKAGVPGRKRKQRYERIHQGLASSGKMRAQGTERSGRAGP